ncbi:bifunctional D-altronate/D-mannonate dehydratase [Arthrobacter livingstonensis]|uniref:Bifunctional D-altronate/D-mannonate dehydratase n=1 Tax=Arthrobacter livingstonensis TaxID=670078 RepID=A0A2V5L7C7_9MICC|nr:D-mannonate dehydratase ManD [Arthrobacter livingstonensis]PYI65503.1 bifunctional D-altronate/D-mannonate dehydratase [Arthrobacter livingstonensis]
MPRTIVAADVIVTSPSRNYVTLKITTSDGVVGWGDATVNGRELSVASYLKDHLAPALLGRDADRIEDTWNYFYKGAYWRRGPITMAAIGAIDMALWDIKGKALGVPVYQLLGGAVRDKILTYTHATGWDLPELLDSVDERRGEGFRAVRAQAGVPGLDKVYGVTNGTASYEPAGRGTGPVEEGWDTASYLRHIPDILAGVRDHVGPELKLLHDAHHRLNPTEAIRLAKALEPVDLFWLEDVIPVENQQLLREVRRQTSIPLAIGEVFNTVWDCQQLITERSLDFIRTAIVHAGGISHVRKILALAEVYQVKGAPHGPSDVSPLNMSASLHLGLATTNFAIQEFMGYDPLVTEVFQSSYTFDDGYLHPGDEPGLGVTFDEKAAAQFPYKQAYLPIARDLDGTMRDW